MKQRKTPFVCHLFICTRSRDGEKKSCGNVNALDFKSALKTEIQNLGWKGKVRVSESSCLGLCAAGPNIMIYPQKIWLASVAPNDLPEIIEIVGEIVKREGSFVPA